LPARIDRAAGELTALMAASDRSTTVRDPFALDRPFGHLIGGLAGE
jgi:FMN reductase